MYMKLFYLKNYKKIHHVLNMMLFLFILYITGNIILINNFLFQIFFLFISYRITKLSLHLSGLDSIVLLELKKY